MNAVDRISKSLDEVINRLADLMHTLEIKTMQKTRGVVIIAPNHYWGELTADQQYRHMEIVRNYGQVTELLNAWFYNSSEDLTRQLKQAQESLEQWVELQSNWSLSTDREKNELKMKECSEKLYKLFAVLRSGPVDHVIAVPDTNSLLAEPDPAKYKNLLRVLNFEFLLMPTVLCELDELKMLHRNPNVRDKAKKIIKRIKGWRSQGSLLNGVTVDKTINVRAIHQEPDVENSLAWLDPKSADDRLIASTLTLQSTHPTARIILITGDINLQNKADAALIEILDLAGT